MASTPIVPSRAAPVQPTASSTLKDQKALQLPEEYDAQRVNQEFDRVHLRLNKILVEATALADLAVDGSASNTVICTRINALAEILRDSGLLKRS